jgi:thioester reductase-like protein
MPATRGVFLTGATGSLGQYLLRDLLAAGRPVVVLARDSRHQRADDRMAERVAFWSDVLKRPLPSPVVLAGELGPDGPALSAPDRRWLARACGAVLHAAANLSFRPAPDGEPWRTNVHGTEALVRLCTEAGLSEWHHVSTAFVCGRRTGTVREVDLDRGQDFHNPYEQSKLEAERRLRAAPGLRLTVYRPAVIVGDSRTGYTSSYDGLYRLLELAARVAEVQAPSPAGGPGAPRRFPLRLPLAGTERSNLVPVDWVSRAIVELTARPDQHGKTFHLISRSPVEARLIHRVASEELRLEGVEFVGREGVAAPSRLEELFRDGLRDYWPYLAGSPAFADDNTARALSHLPPPAVGAALLRRLIRFAVAARWGRRQPTCPDAGGGAVCAEYVEHTFPRQARRSRLARAARLHLLVGLDVRGPGGGQWSCRWAHGELCYVARGLDGRADVTYHTDVATFEAVVQGRQTPQQAFFEQRLAITGDLETALKLAALLRQFLSENPCPDPRRTEAMDATPR